MVTEPTQQVGTRLMFEHQRVRVWHLDRPEACFNVPFQDDEVKFLKVGPIGEVGHPLTKLGTKRHRLDVIELKRR